MFYTFQNFGECPDDEITPKPPEIKLDDSSFERFNKCPRHVTKSKYEHKDPSAQNWWKRTFDMLEKEFAIPQDQRPEVIMKVFPEKLLKRILEIIDRKKELLNAVTEKYAQGHVPDSLLLLLEDKVAKQELASCPSIPEFFPGMEEEEEIEEEEEVEEDIYELLGIQVPKVVLEEQRVKETVEEKPKESTESVETLSCKKHVPLSLENRLRRTKVVGAVNPYLNFFRRRPDRAAIWRTLPPLSLDEMTLSQRAEAITNRIATDFVSWIESIHGTDMVKLDVPTILNMFKFSFEIGHAATSTQVRVKEMPCVPASVANARSVPGKAERSTLVKYLHRDIRNSRLPPRKVAFGRCLPIEMQRFRPKEDLKAKWFSCKVPPKLTDMASVWENITKLRSTREYCEWIAKEDMPCYPEFLVKQGLIKDPNLSYGTRISLGDAEVPPPLKKTIEETKTKKDQKQQGDHRISIFQ